MLYMRKIKCPRHFLLRPGGNPWIMKQNPLVKDMPQWAFKKWPNLRRLVPVKDKRGNKVMNREAYYQPEISDAFAIEHVYDPKNPICKIQCKGRCLEGKGMVNARGIKRLSGAT